MIAEVVVDAERLAGRLLGRATRRWEHSAAVAKAAMALTTTVERNESDVLVAAAWLHDVGYSAAIVETGFHPLDGARYLRSLGWPHRVCCLVANHTNARIEADARGLAAALAAEFPAERTPVADALTYVDLTTSPDGEPVTVHERLTEILERYGPGHVVHESISRATPDLIATVRRVEDRLACSVAG